MPKLISRQEAIARIQKENHAIKCLACNLVKTREKYVLSKGKYVTSLLSAYPRCWGQVMVIVNRHITAFSEFQPKEWQEFSQHILLASRAVEAVLNPLRCYVTASGSNENLAMTTPHLHFNIIPVYHKTDKPSTIFTWEYGLYSGTEEEWEGLYVALKGKWDSNKK